ncbi:MAG: hypothetical protein ACKOBR_05760, partial [Actinomycetota bacterium]
MTSPIHPTRPRRTSKVRAFVRRWTPRRVGVRTRILLTFVVGAMVLSGVLFFMVYGRQFLDQLKMLLRLRLTYFQAAIDNPEALPALIY